MDQKQTLSERSEFRLFPIFCNAQNVMTLASSPVGQVCGRLFLAYLFLAKQKKVSGRRATPGLHPRSVSKLSGVSLTVLQDNTHPLLQPPFPTEIPKRRKHRRQHQHQRESMEQDTTVFYLFPEMAFSSIFSLNWPSPSAGWSACTGCLGASMPRLSCNFTARLPASLHSTFE
jgi:hypothetical protein